MKNPFATLLLVTTFLNAARAKQIIMGLVYDTKDKQTQPAVIVEGMGYRQ